MILLNKTSPFGVDSELCKLADLFFMRKQQHYTN